MPFTIALAIGAALNVVGFVSFLLRRRTWGWAALARVQIGNILFSLVAAVVVSPVWLLLNTAPSATTLILSVVLRKVEAARAMATRCETPFGHEWLHRSAATPPFEPEWLGPAAFLPLAVLV